MFCPIFLIFWILTVAASAAFGSLVKSGRMSSWWSGWLWSLLPMLHRCFRTTPSFGGVMPRALSIESVDALAWVIGQMPQNREDATGRTPLAFR
jgi:hypothetical protein